MPRSQLDHQNYQGGKKWGQVKQQQADAIDEVIEVINRENRYPDVEDLDEKLEQFKGQFIKYDIDGNGELDDSDVRAMMESLGQPKNNLEIRKMIKEIDLNGSGTINFYEFVVMMLGGKNSIMRKILLFEEMAKEKEKPTGLPPKRDLSSLP